jgi:hypothetical protein
VRRVTRRPAATAATTPRGRALPRLATPRPSSASSYTASTSSAVTASRASRSPARAAPATRRRSVTPATSRVASPRSARGLKVHTRQGGRAGSERPATRTASRRGATSPRAPRVTTRARSATACAVTRSAAPVEHLIPLAGEAPRLSPTPSAQPVMEARGERREDHEGRARPNATGGEVRALNTESGRHDHGRGAARHDAVHCFSR